MSSPNILLILGDQHPVFLAGAYGHRSVKSPNLDGLATRGAVFDAAYAASPICAPCRASMMTGRFPSTIEVWDNASPLRSDWPTFAHTFRANGYRTILCGKMHFVGPDQHHGFEERWVQDIYPADFRWTRPTRAGVPRNDGQNMKAVLSAGARWTRDMDYDEEVCFRAEYGLRRMDASKRPFFLCVSFTGPHHPYCAPEKYFNLYGDDDVDLPELPEGFMEREHEYVRWVRHHGTFEELVPDDVVRTARRAHLARVTMLDDYIGRVLAALDRSGRAEETIVVYTSDHGDMLGEHGLWFKNVSYEWSARVPLIFAGPGIPARRIREAVGLLDFYDTLPGLAGLSPVYARSDGRDLSDLIRGKRNSDPLAYALMENYGEGIWRGMRTIRRGELKLNYVSGSSPELFDLARDPGEWDNVAEDPSYAGDRRELQEIVCRDWDMTACDEAKWQSEERRKAIMESIGEEPLGWQIPSTSPEHPLHYDRGVRTAKTPRSPDDL